MSDIIKDQTDALDLNELENFYNDNGANGFNFLNTLNEILNGKYEGTENFFDYIKKILFQDINSLLPPFIAVIVIVLLYEILNGLKSSALSDNVGSMIRFATVLAVSLLLTGELCTIFINTKNLINNIGIFSEIMSPIIITLMIASNGAVSVGIYKPSVVLFSDVIIGIFNNIIMPVIGMIFIFNLISYFTKEIRIKKFADFFASAIKWIFAVIIFSFGFIITVQGLTVSNIDGISVKVAKYALSNSVPIVGGLVKDSLDIVAAGSVMIKNAVGLSGLIGMFYILLSPLLHIIVFSLFLKLTAAITDVYSDGAISELLTSLSKTTSYLIAAICTVAILAFILILLMIFSANTVI